MDNITNDQTEAIPLKVPGKTNSFPWKIYLSRALSAWGERIWMFGAGIFMVNLNPENLRLVAIYGFVLSVSVIVFGPFVGKWIDQTQRLRAALICMVMQNIPSAVSCVFLGLYFAEVKSFSLLKEILQLL